MDVTSLIESQARGDFRAMEQVARRLLGSGPQEPSLHNALGISLAMQGRFAEAAKAFGEATALAPHFAEAHSNLGNVFRDLGRRADAVQSYGAALRAAPASFEARLNLAIVLSELGRTAEGLHHIQQGIAIGPDIAAAHQAYAALFGATIGEDAALLSHRRACALAPDMAPAHSAAASILRGQGNLPEAARSLRRSLALDPRAAPVQTGLANLYRDTRRDVDALLVCDRTLAIDTHQADAHNTRGMLLRAKGNIPAALKSYAAATALAPAAPAAIHNLGLALYESGRLETASIYLDRSDLPGAAPRSLHCSYMTRDLPAFRRKLAKLAGRPNVFPLVANLSAHHAVNFGTDDPYGFCPNPFDFIYQAKVAAPEVRTPLIGELLEAVDHDTASGTPQPLLHEGIQSTGDLLNRPVPAFRRLADLVQRHIAAYRERFAARTCVFIREFPEVRRFYSSWYVRMRQGGHLSSHIHESGWLSGVTYLAMPPRQGDGTEGCIQFSIDGGDYPASHADFPARTLAVEVGDIVLFPSSLFHRTIPFASADERICIAFDVLPKEFPAEVTS